MLKLSRSLKTVFKTVAIGIPAGITLVDLVGYVARVEGFSMQPVFNPESSSGSCDYVFLYNWPITTNSYNTISRGDIIAVVSPRNPKQRIIKRVIALAGDVVETHGYHKSFVTIPQGHCWIEGDHRGQSLDSNIFGPVALGLVKSKAKCIVWPPSRWQMLNEEMLKDRIPVNLLSRKKIIEQCDIDSESQSVFNKSTKFT